MVYFNFRRSRMKRIGLLVLTIVVLLGLSGCSSIGNKKAEFDGGYILASDDTFIPLTEVKASVTQISRGGMSIMSLMRSPKTYYILDASTNAKISQNDIKGFFLKGNYDFNNFTLNHLEKKKLGKNEGLFENKGPATRAKPFYYAGKEVKIKRKKAENGNGYIYVLDEKLSPGKYVGWTGLSFWVFEIK